MLVNLFNDCVDAQPNDGLYRRFPVVQRLLPLHCPTCNIVTESLEYPPRTCGTHLVLMSEFDFYVQLFHLLYLNQPLAFIKSLKSIKIKFDLHFGSYSSL